MPIPPLVAAIPDTDRLSPPKDAPAESAGRRDPFFDNAKYLAIVLVACAHAWEPLREGSRAVTALYMVVYAFHMPAFILVSGHFSRSFEARPRQIQRLLTGIALPFVLFETVYVLFNRWLSDDPQQPISLTDPWYLTWFLTALFVWRLTAPIWKVVRWPVPLALLVAVLASTSAMGDTLDLQRVLQFLPYFVLGLCMRSEHFLLVRRRAVRLPAVAVFAGAAAVAYWSAPRMNPSWLYHHESAQEMAVPWWVGPLMTLALFGCGLLLTVCFFAWVPGRHMWFTTLGAGTLYGYLLHGFLTKASHAWGWYEPDWLDTPYGPVVVTAVAMLAITALCTAPVRKVFRFAVEPDMRWAFRKS